MNILFKLLKINMINTFSLNTLASKKKKSDKTKKSKIIGSIVVYALLAAIIVFYTAFFSIMIAQSGMYNTIIVLGAGLGGMLCLLMTLGQSYGILFQSKDYEMLATLPIKKSKIVASKLLSLTLMSQIYFNVPFITSVVIYCLFTGFQLYFVLPILLGVIFGPFLVVSICSALAFLLGRLLSGFKYKNLLSSIVSVAFIIIVFILSFSISSLETQMPEEELAKFMAEKINAFFSKAYIVSDFLSSAFEGDFLSLLWFLLISIVPFSLFVFVTAKNYVRINENQKSSYKVKNFKLEKQKNNSHFIALIKKEAKLLFSTNTYFMNVITSPLMSSIMLIAIAFTLKEEDLIDGLKEFVVFVPLAIIVIQMLTMGMTTSSSSSISMEGKNFWILKTSPLDGRTILKVKGIFHVILCLPFILINFIVSLIFFDINVIDAIVMQMTVIFGVGAESMISLWLNTINYKLDWDNPAQVVKSSSNTLLTMLCSFVMNIILGIPIGISIIINLTNPILVCLVAAILFVCATLVLFKNGLKRYGQIEV